MKWVFAFTILLGTAAFGQAGQKPLPADVHFKKPYRINNESRVTLLDSNSTRKIVRLPVDNMPCIVPNMHLLKAMPNAGDSLLLKRPVDPGIYVHRNNGIVRIKNK